MTGWAITIAVGVLMLCQMIVGAADLVAQGGGNSPYERLSPGNQKAARALFEAQRPQLPPGTKALTLDEIAGMKQSGDGWSRILETMKSRGLVTARNLGEAITSYDERHHLSAEGSAQTVRAYRQ